MFNLAVKQLYIMKKISILALFILVASGSFAQKSLEFGLNLGTSAYLGDLNPDIYTPNERSLSFGVQSKFNFNSLLSARVSLNRGTVTGDDANSDRSDIFARNLSFRSRITELAFIGEVNFLHFGKHRFNKSTRNYFRFSPYLFGGLAVFNFNPETKYNGRWYDLQPLGTEGQDLPNSTVSSYNLTQISIPFGAGLKFQLEPNMILSYEIGWRKTFTDYLDDVSGAYADLSAIQQSNGSIASELAYRGDEIPSNTAVPNQGAIRGNPENDDWYIMSTFTFSYKLFRRHGKFTAKY